MLQSSFTSRSYLHQCFYANCRPCLKKLIVRVAAAVAGALLLINLFGAEAAVRDLSAKLNSWPPPATGAVSFSADSYRVDERAGNAIITVKRTGGTDNRVVAKVTVADVTASAADYRFSYTSLDTSFNYGEGKGVGPFGIVGAIALPPDGKILVGGQIYSWNGDTNASHHILRLHPDGTLDHSFNYGGRGATGPNNLGEEFVQAIALQPDGKIIISGQFIGYNGDPNASDNVLRLNSDGTLDTSFNYGGAGASGVIRAVVVQPDGKILIGGGGSTPDGKLPGSFNPFTSYNGDANASDGLVRLNADGTLDTSFNYGSGKGAGGGAVQGIALQPDGKIIIAGPFESYNGDLNASDNVLRVNADGTLDHSFNYGSGKGTRGVSVLAVQPDGKIIIGGSFTSYNNDVNASDGIARLNSDGTLDTSFNYGSDRGVGSIPFMAFRPPFPGVVDMVALQPDGKILMHGNFPSYNGESPVNTFLRLNTDGTLDHSFNYGGRVLTVATQPDEKLLVGGGLSGFPGAQYVNPGILRIEPDLFLTWEAGDASDKVIQIPILADAIEESNETFTLTLTPRIEGASAGTPSTATVTITDGNLTISEVYGTGVTGRRATFRAKLTDAGAPLSGKIIRFKLGFTDVGQATTDVNGVATLSNAVILGRAVGTYPSEVTAIFSGDETFSPASLSGPLIVTASPVAQLSTGSYSVGEGSGRVTITVSRNDSLGTASVQHTTSDSSGLAGCNVNTGNASARCDYLAVGGTLIFAPGELSKTFTIPVINDLFVEGPETLTVTLSNATGLALDTPSSATVTITDDDTTQGAANPIDTREFLVRQLYLDFLNREPDPPGQAAWLDRLNTCPRPGETIQNCDEIEVASAFFRSPESFDRSFFIYKFYEGSLVRQPQYDEYQSDLRRLTGFLTAEELEQRKQEFAEEFVNRTEFHSLYDSFGSGQPFVDAVLARAGSARPGVGAATIVTANRVSVINRLAAGQITRGQALRELMESAEVSRRFYNKAFVVEEYFGFLRRNPDAAYLNWINVLNTTGDYREMIRGFLQSAEYRFRFGPA